MHVSVAPQAPLGIGMALIGGISFGAAVRWGRPARAWWAYAAKRGGVPVGISERSNHTNYM